MSIDRIDKLTKLKNIILSSLEDDQAEDIVIIDLANKTSIADYMIIATGRANRHIIAMADHLLLKLRDLDLGKVTAEGMKQADWVLIDAKDVIIHLFRKEIRELYNLEKLWQFKIPSEVELIGE